MACLPYARGEGGDSAQARAGSVVHDVRGNDARWAFAVSVPALCFAAWAQARPMVAAASLLALGGLILLLRRWFLRRLGGCTGDTLGAAEQFGEIVVLLVFAATGSR
jgi:adenosylcobinamide-GDP ribazoletransferase